MVFKKSRFKSVREFYEAIDRLIEWLKAEGKTEEADRLDHLFNKTAWTTGSELLGEIMLAMRKFKGKYSPELSKEIKECRKFAENHRWYLGLR